jgi:nicotinamide riboside transporter PnuC
MDWITGAITLLAMELTYRKRWEGWALGLVNQACWFYLVFTRGLWGLLPLTTILTWRYAVYLIAWRRDELSNN